jgi:hypothetical protein
LLDELHKQNPDEIKPELAVTLIGPAVGVAGVIISWAYKSASIRLGIVDLFGCEIATLCRVGTIFDVGTHYIRAYEGRAGEGRWGGKARSVR